MAENTCTPTSTDPTGEPHGPEPVGDSAALARRRLMLGGGALAGSAIATLLTARPAAAGHDTNIAYDSQTTMHLDVTNTTAGSTRISSNISGTAAFVALNNYPVGISRPDGMLGRTTYTTSNCAGVAGSCEAAAGGIGVLGTCNNQTGIGVHGYSGSSVPFIVGPTGTGVYASGPLNGLVAEARNAGGVSVHGAAPGAGGLAGLFSGRTRVDGDLQAETLRLTRTSGRKTLAQARKSTVITGVPVTASSVVVATLQNPRAGIHVASAQPLPAEDKIKITFNKVAPQGTTVGWILVN